MKDIDNAIKQLGQLKLSGMYNEDFLLTWEKEPRRADGSFLKQRRYFENCVKNNISPKIFDSGLAVSLFRDNSTRNEVQFCKCM